MPISPLVGLMALVTIAAMITFGNTRYRAQAEVAIVTAAVVGFDALSRRWRGEPSDPLSASSPAHDADNWPKAPAAVGG